MNPPRDASRSSNHPDVKAATRKASPATPPPPARRQPSHLPIGRWREENPGKCRFCSGRSCFRSGDDEHVICGAKWIGHRCGQRGSSHHWPSTMNRYEYCPGESGMILNHTPSLYCIMSMGDASQFVKSAASLTELAEGASRRNSMLLDLPFADWAAGFPEPFLPRLFAAKPRPTPLSPLCLVGCGGADASGLTVAVFDSASYFFLFNTKPASNVWRSSGTDFFKPAAGTKSSRCAAI